MKKPVLAEMTDPQVALAMSDQPRSGGLNVSAFWVKTWSWLCNPASD
jgi:hypothetical protein